MIIVKFFYSENGLCKGFSVKGHAGSGKFGQDLVCCAVSSVVQMCCNGLTEVLKVPTKVYVADGFIRLWVASEAFGVQVLLNSLELELKSLAQHYKKNLKFFKLEV